MPEISSPADYGLPKRFAAFRPGQEECADKIITSDKRFLLLDAPTGAGKSLTYMAAAAMMGARVLILTGTKGLQSQLMKDFESAGMRDVRGQSNYRCVALDSGPLSGYGRAGSGCDVGPCHVGIYCSLKQEGGCGYYDAQAAARKANMVVTNYAYWLTLGRHSDPDVIGKFDLLVLDEAHTAPEWLADFCTVDLNKSEIKKLLGMDLPPLNEGVQVWSDWARGASAACRAEYTRTRDQLGNSKQAATKKLLRLTEIGRDLVELSKAGQWKRSDTARRDTRMPGVATDWIAESTSKGVKFSPIWAHEYAEPYMFRGIKQIVLSSATLSPAVARYLGVGKLEYEYIEAGSGFDPKRRPLIYIPTTRVDRKMVIGQKRQWIRRIDAIIEKRLDRKGIIHTRSYSRAQEILSMSKHKGIMMTHKSYNSRDTIKRFERSKAPCVLVSPSVEEGFDFPGDKCRYQIIAKVPFIDGRGALTKARTASDKKYPYYITALSLIQMVGRGTRSADDFCETFIIDDHWLWFRRAARFPKWFKRAWVNATKVPRPMPLDGGP